MHNAQFSELLGQDLASSDPPREFQPFVISASPVSFQSFHRDGSPHEITAKPRIVIVDDELVNIKVARKYAASVADRWPRLESGRGTYFDPAELDACRAACSPAG